MLAQSWRELIAFVKHSISCNLTHCQFSLYRIIIFLWRNLPSRDVRSKETSRGWTTGTVAVDAASNFFHSRRCTKKRFSLFADTHACVLFAVNQNFMMWWIFVQKGKRYRGGLCTCINCCMWLIHFAWVGFLTFWRFLTSLVIYWTSMSWRKINCHHSSLVKEGF